MNFSEHNSSAKNVSFDAENMRIEFTDGRKLSVPLAYFPRLLHADPDSRTRYTISGGGIGVHWEELDEDVSVEHLLMGIGDRTRQTVEMI